MLVSEIREEIKEDVQDGSFADDYIDRVINRGLRAASKEVLFPVLETNAPVETVVGSQFVDLPDDFGHNLFFVSCKYSDDITIFSNLGAMLRSNKFILNEPVSGTVKRVAIHAKQLAYDNVPAESHNLWLFYYTWPTALTANQSVDIYIEDEEAQEDILMNFVKWKLFKKIEDEEGDPMQNTLYHKRMYEEAVKKLKLKTRQGQSRPEPPRDSQWAI